MNYHFPKNSSFIFDLFFFIQMLGKRLLRKRATLQDIFRLYQVVHRSAKTLAILKDLDCATINNALCDPLEDVLSVCVLHCFND